jgi:hypothetical protein
MFFALLACAGDISAGDFFWKKKSDYQGTVRDMTTGLPLEGVYVLAVYYGGGGSMFGHSATWCVKTRGAYSGKDGSFRLPREPEGNPGVYPIKIGYLKNSQATSKAREKAGGEAVGPPYDVEMEPQVPGKGKTSQFIQCERPKSRADAADNVKYLKILTEEFNLYKPGSNFIESLEESISLLENAKAP